MISFMKKFGVGALVAMLIATPALALADSGKRDDNSRPHAGGSSLEIMINDNGKTVVRGAKVTNVSGSTVTAQTIWGASSITWTVRTDSDTNFLRKSGTNAGIADIAVGDYVSFSGMLSSGSAFTVDADVVKNWSLSENRTAITGTVTAHDNDSLTIATMNRGNVEVAITSSTKFSGSIDALADITTNSRVVVLGSYNADTKVLTATEIRSNLKVKDGELKGKGWGQFLKDFKFDFWKK